MIDGLNEEIVAVWSDAELFLTHRLRDVVVCEREGLSRDQEARGRTIVRAPMPGLVMSVNVLPQAQVENGETLLVLGCSVRSDERLLANVKAVARCFGRWSKGVLSTLLGEWDGADIVSREL